MGDRRALVPWIAAPAAGVAVWVAIARLTGMHEAWDHALYWSVGYPLMIAVAGALGWLYPKGAWRWGFLPVIAQGLPILAQDPGASLMPLGAILLAILALPLAFAASLAARLRRRREPGG